MKPERYFIVAGGDVRQIHLAERLSDKYNILLTGFDKFEGSINNIPLDAISDGIADAIILPVPVSDDGYTLRTPFSDKTIMLKDLVSKAAAGGYVYGGVFSDEARRIFTQNSIKTEDYSAREEFSVKNALATAEACIQIIMENTERMISGMNILITGFGRIGKVLAERLHGLGANVTVAVRKKSDMSWAEIYGCKYADINDKAAFSADYSVIVNTVPSMVIGRDIIDVLNKNVLITDLASKPGGVDFAYASSKNIKTIHALALPGKKVPVSAGIIIADTIENMIRERSGGE